jgi:hypothetical protein
MSTSLQKEAARQFKEIVAGFLELTNCLPYSEGLKVDKVFDKVIDYDRLQEARISAASRKKIEGV